MNSGHFILLILITWALVALLSKWSENKFKER